MFLKRPPDDMNGHGDGDDDNDEEEEEEEEEEEGEDHHYHHHYHQCCRFLWGSDKLSSLLYSDIV